LAWAERAGYQDLEDIEPITVAAYIEILQRRAAPPTVKQHMAAIRMLFSWLTEKGVLAMNPAREVKTERFSRTEGKPPPSSKVKFKSFWKRSRHPRSPARRHGADSVLITRYLTVTTTYNQRMTAPAADKDVKSKAGAEAV
jgi:hypothetical protein